MRIATLILTCLLVASCTTTSSSNAALSPTPTAAAETEAEAPRATGPEIDPTEVVAAVERLLTTPHRAESFFEFPAGEQADAPDPNRPVSSYEFDGTWSSTTILFGPNQASAEPMGFTITDRATAYFYLPGFADSPVPVQASDNPMVYAYDSWISVDVAQVRAAVPPDVPFTIQGSALDELDGILGSLRTAETAKEGPRSSSRGVETRTFELVVEEDGEIDLFDSTSIITIHLDAEDRVREMTSVNDPFPGSRIEFFDFDEEITIELPADAVDRTAEFVEQFAAVAPPRPTAVPQASGRPPIRPFSGPSVLEVLDAQPELSIFRELITEGQNVELMLDLPNPEPWTIFAPTNDALEALGPALDELRSKPLRAQTFVFEYIIEGSYSLDQLVQLGSIQSFGRTSIRVTSDNGIVSAGLLGNPTPVLIGDLDAGDGVVHIITGTLNFPLD